MKFDDLFDLFDGVIKEEELPAPIRDAFIEFEETHGGGFGFGF